jgi:ribulose-phosphate 3-epimerase
MNPEIIPAILSTNSADYHKKIKAIEPYTDWVQIDIVDNKFAHNLTINADLVSSIRTKLKLEIQLMVEFIEDWLDPFVKTNPGRIIVPYESCRDPLGVINHLRQHQIDLGFSLNPETPTERLKHLIDKIDTALLLSVHPGFSGQHFVVKTLDKIRELRAMNSNIVIEVDGGIEPGTAAKCAQVGANILVAGSFIFGNDTISGNTYREKVVTALDLLRKSVNNASAVGA